MQTQSTDLLKFSWLVHDSMEIVDRDGHRILEARSDPSIARPKFSHPLEERGLFRHFADLSDGGENAILAFASKFGLLGIENEERLLGEYKDPWMLSGEELVQTWKHYISDMRHLVSLWNALQTHDLDRVAAVCRFDRGTGGNWIKRMPKRPELSHLKSVQVSSQEVIEEGWEDLAVWLSIALKDFPLSAGCEPSHGGPPRLSLSPRSLIGALWLQFASAVGDNASFQRCEQCGRWFEPGRDKRSDAKFCRDACRSKFYRAKKERARELHAKKVRVPEIAKRLDSDVETVKGWVKK